jgi:hypothetical protein
MLPQGQAEVAPGGQMAAPQASAGVDPFAAQPAPPAEVPQTPQVGMIEGAVRKGFDFMFGGPSPEEAQKILETQPTDPNQRARLQQIVSGAAGPSDLEKAGSFFFGKEENTNILGKQEQTPTFGLAEPSSSTATGEDPFSAPIVQPAAPAMADPSQQIQLKDSGSSTVGLNSTQAMLQERFGAPTISAIQSAEEGLGMRTDAQGRMVDPGVDRSSFNQASADREARQAAQSNLGKAVSDRDRRAARGDGMSDADRRDIAKANAQGASASDIARGDKVAGLAGIDRRTGKPLAAEGAGGMTEYQRITALQRQKEIDMKVQDGMDVKAAKKEVEFEESRNNVRSTQDSFNKLKPVAEEIAKLSGTVFTEGALGWAAAKLPLATDAGQIERLTTEFEGSAFLQGLIEAKAKGATFGALSQQEGDRILGQWGTITSPDSTNEQRITAINNMLGSIQRSSERAASDHNEKFPNRSATPEASGSSGGQRYTNDQDHGAKVETHFQS